MKIGILGGHPKLSPGFSSAMALNQIAAFSARGHTVHLFIPDTVDDRVRPKIERLGPEGLGALPKYGQTFTMSTVQEGDTFPSDLDVLIWQSYHARHEPLYPKKREFLTAKHFPRFVADTSEHYRRKALHQLKKYDLVALSLHVDVELVGTMHPDEHARFGHVPRGFSTTWLNPADKPSQPVVACDAAVKAEDGGERAITHMRALFDRLAKRGERPSIAATRHGAKQLRADRPVPPLDMIQFYRRMFHPAWIYMPCDFDYSVHNRNKFDGPDGKPVYIGLYENQVVEAQMAGVIPLVQRGHVDPEILFDETICTVSDYQDTDELVARYDAIVADFQRLSNRARTFAIANNSHDAMATAWLNLITPNLR